MELWLNQAETGLYVVEVTTVFSAWLPVATNRVRDGSVWFADAAVTNSAQRIHRAVPAVRP